MNGRKCSRLRPLRYSSDGARLLVVTTVTPASISAVNSRDRIIASGELVTIISSNASSRAS